MRWKRRVVSIMVSLLLVWTGIQSDIHVYAKELEGITAKSYLLMDATTGRIIIEKNGEQERMLASVTKIMSMLLIEEAISAGDISLEDMVTVSKYAASMGGSQVFLEEGEQQSVDTMLKCIAVSSANDACVAMAEKVAGTEEKFVERMNQRAKELGMVHTVFANCCGLDDRLEEGQHHSSAKDIAIMSRELIMNHNDICKYSVIWMDKIVHKTKKGEKEFGLSNTNKLLRTYDGITGLKTGSTSKAKYCLSATANRNGVELIAVVLAASNPTERFQDAAALLDYGFANCKKYEGKKDFNESILVRMGKKERVNICAKERFNYLLVGSEKNERIETKIQLPRQVEAPIKKGERLGYITYFVRGKEIGKTELLAGTAVKRQELLDVISVVVKRLFCLRFI